MRSLLLVFSIWIFASNAAAADVQCALLGANAMIQRTSDGTSIGDSVTSAECSQAVGAANAGVVCARFASDWYPTNIDKISKLGQALSLSDCTTVTRNARAEVVCTLTGSGGGGPWRPTHTATGTAFGRFGTSLDDCATLTANASKGLVCTNTGTYGFKGRKPTIVNDKAYTDANLMGASGQQAPCARATKEARNGYVCVCNGDFCGDQGWTRHQIASRRSVPPTTSISSCIDQQ